MNKNFALVFEHVQKRKQELESVMLQVNDQIVKADMSGDHTMRDALLAARASTATALKEVQAIFDHMAYLLTP